MGGSKPASLQVVYAWQDQAAATGDGTRYEACDGSVWRPVRPFEQATGDLAGDRIVPRAENG